MRQMQLISIGRMDNPIIMEVVKIALPLVITMNSHHYGMIGLAQTNTASFVKNREAKVCSMKFTGTLQLIHNFNATSKACDCHPDGVESCNKENGICICKPNVIGYTCDACEDGYYGDPSNCQGKSR